MQFYRTSKKLHFQSFSKFLKRVQIINMLEKYDYLGMITSKIIGKRIV